MKLTHRLDNEETKAPETKVAKFHGLTKKESTRTHYTLDISDFEHEPQELNEIFTELSNANEYDTLEVNISSWGGLAFELQRFLNTFQRYFYKRVTTILNPNGYSCGALIFLAGDKRVVFENSHAMFHEVSMGIFGKHSDVKVQAKFEEKYYDKFFRDCMQYFFSEEELQRIFSGEEFWLDAIDLCERGIATHCVVFGIELTAKEYLDYIKNPKEREKFLNELKEGSHFLTDLDSRRVNYELDLLNKSKNLKTTKISKNTKASKS